MKPSKGFSMFNLYFKVSYQAYTEQAASRFQKICSVLSILQKKMKINMHESQAKITYCQPYSQHSPNLSSSMG